MIKEKKLLPDGYYEIIILDAVIEKNIKYSGNHLKIAYEVVGPEEYKGYFDFDYRNQNTENNRWHGFFYISIPNPNPNPNSEYYSYNAMKKYKEFLQNLNKSNPEYVFDRKLSSLRGLRLGAYIGTQPYTRTNGSTCKIKTVSRICSVNEYYLNRCEDTPLFFLDCKTVEIQ